MRQQQASSRVDSLANEASRLAKEQRDQSDRTRQLFGQQGDGSQSGIQDKRKLADEREGLANDLGKLEKELQDTARQLATDRQTAASTKLRDALGDMQQSDLRARIQRGADWMRRGIDPNANGAEPEIAAGMQRLEKEVRDAQQAMGAAPQQGNDSQQGLETALNRVERLRNQMGSLTRDGQGRQQGQKVARAKAQGGQAKAGSRADRLPAVLLAAQVQESVVVPTVEAIATPIPAAEVWPLLRGNIDTGNNTPRGGPPVQPDNSPIPPQRAYNDSMRDLNQLRQSVRDDPDMAKQVQELIREMERLDPSRFPGNPASGRTTPHASAGRRG